jgi:hypothetical protein
MKSRRSPPKYFHQALSQAWLINGFGFASEENKRFQGSAREASPSVVEKILISKGAMKVILCSDILRFQRAISTIS